MLSRTIIVPSQEAATVQAANAIAGDGDTIQIQVGTFVGVVDVRVNNLRFVGSGTDSIIDAQRGGAVFTVSSSGVVIENLRLTGGRSSNIHGGAIQVLDRAGVLVRNCLIDGNEARIAGGAISVNGRESRLTVVGSTFTGNVAARNVSMGFAGLGSVILVTNGAAAVIDDCEFRNNDAWRIGVIYAAGLNRFDVQIPQDYPPPQSLEVTNSRFINNGADQGTAIVGQSDYLLVANSLFVSNGGSAIEAAGVRDALILNNTIHNQQKGIVVTTGSGETRVLNNSVSGSNAVPQLGISCPPTVGGIVVVDFNNVFQAGLAYSAATQPGPGSVAIAPGFRNPGQFDFSLADDSGLKNIGATDPGWSNSDGTRATIGYTGGILSAVASGNFQFLPQEIRSKLTTYVTSTLRAFVDPEGINTLAGVPHSFLPVGASRKEDPVTHLTKRGYGSHFVPNEAGLFWKVLAVSYKAGWLNSLGAAASYSASWGMIRKGLETFVGITGSADPMRFRNGMLFRTYLTTQNDVDLAPENIVRGIDEQSADDNLLFLQCLDDLEGLVLDPELAIPVADRESILGMIRTIRSRIRPEQFVVNGKIVFTLTNGVPSSESWNRLSAEGAILLGKLLLHSPERFNITDFEQVLQSLEEKSAVYRSHSSGQLDIPSAVFQGQMFVTALRNVHGLPITLAEASGATSYQDSVVPTLRAQLDFMSRYSLLAIGDHVMTGDLNGITLDRAANAVDNKGPAGMLPGNEPGTVPVLYVNMPRVTSATGMLGPLARVRSLPAADVLRLVDSLSRFEPEFFDQQGFGWQTVIPFRPDDRSFSYVGSDGQFKYTDYGDIYSILHSSYMVLSVYEALNPDNLLSAMNSQYRRWQHIVNRMDSGVPLPTALFAAPGIRVEAVESGVKLTEGQPAMRYRVRLASMPTHDVTIRLTTDAQAAVSTQQVTVAAAAWDQGVEIQLLAMDDVIVEGNHQTVVNLQSASLDPFYAARSADLPIEISDNDSAPDAPDLVAPASQTELLRPEFRWTAVPSAVSYELKLSRESVPSEPFLSISTAATSFTPAADLSIGRLIAQIRAVLPGGMKTAWTSKSIQIQTRVNLNPIPSQFPTTRPTLTWQSLPGAAIYDIWINYGPTSQSQIVRVQDIASTTWSSAVELPIGNYLGWVRAIDSTGVPALWSNPFSFQLAAPVVIGSMPLQQNTAHPQFSWQELPGAERYEIWLSNLDVAGNPIVRDSNVIASRWTTPALAIGRYRLWVRGIDRSGIASSWSAPRDVIVMPEPVLLSPSLPSFLLRPTFEWSPVAGAVTYGIFVRDTRTGLTVINQTGIAGMQFTPPSDLGVSEYRWWVHGRSALGLATFWSTAREFNTTGRTSVLSPQGNSASNRPLFSWQAVAGASRYELWVTNLSSNTRAIHIPDLPVVGYTPATALAKGTYRVWVRAVSVTGSTAIWSTQVDFIISSTSAERSPESFLHFEYPYFGNAEFQANSATAQNVQTAGVVNKFEDSNDRSRDQLIDSVMAELQESTILDERIHVERRISI